MPAAKLNDRQKDSVVHLYTQQDYSQDQLASLFHVSRRTIQRALLERGILQTREEYSAGEKAILKVVRDYGLSPERLVQALASPALTPQNIRNYLAQCSHDELATLFYNTALIKITEMVQAERSHDQTVQPAQEEQAA